MLLIDSHHLFLAAGFAVSKNDEPPSLELFRYSVLDSIRHNRIKFASYGEPIIAAEGDGLLWRRELFPYYKAKRQEGHERSGSEFWSILRGYVTVLLDEIETFMPYRVVRVPSAEADDVIAVLATDAGDDSPITNAERVMIVSGDKDFKQLQRFANVKQYAPTKKREIVSGDPIADLREHIVRGDASDGIPNIFSDDDTFVAGRTQVPVTTKRLNEWMAYPVPGVDYPTRLARNFARNRTLIDLSEIPGTIRDDVRRRFATEQRTDRKRIFEYFRTHELRELMRSIQDF